MVLHTENEVTEYTKGKTVSHVEFWPHCIHFTDGTKLYAWALKTNDGVIEFTTKETD